MANPYIQSAVCTARATAYVGALATGGAGVNYVLQCATRAARWGYGFFMHLVTGDEKYNAYKGPAAKISENADHRTKFVHYVFNGSSKVSLQEKAIYGAALMGASILLARVSVEPKTLMNYVFNYLPVRVNTVNPVLSMLPRI